MIKVELSSVTARELLAVLDDAEDLTPAYHRRLRKALVKAIETHDALRDRTAKRAQEKRIERLRYGPAFEDK